MGEPKMKEKYIYSIKSYNSPFQIQIQWVKKQENSEKNLTFTKSTNQKLKVIDPLNPWEMQYDQEDSEQGRCTLSQETTVSAWELGQRHSYGLKKKRGGGHKKQKRRL